ncbi:YebG family protein [Klebsiella pneumoniae]|uniref:YebG family protein n=1 Tax=Klebsiella pneumoniae TaxID=573 RepID=UPI00396F65AC
MGIRGGGGKMSFFRKKEGDAYDKMLGLAEGLNEWLGGSPNGRAGGGGRVCRGVGRVGGGRVR